MFEKASRMKLRFPTVRGLLSVEDVWEMPLTNDREAFSLDHLAIMLDKKLKESDVTSFVTKKSGPDEVTQLQFDIVKHIIDVRVAESEAAFKAREIKENNQKILQLIAEKSNEELRGKSIEELQTMLK